MPFTRIDQKDLLRYDPTYRILICRDCQYAIQKSAIESHLLRHKIYRDERKRVLLSCAEYELLEAEDVPVPHPNAHPIADISVQAGHCCTVDQCGHLCASPKRMQMHHHQVHNLQHSPNLAPHARPATLQTFFRGSKLRYFEVNRQVGEGDVVAYSSNGIAINVPSVFPESALQNRSIVPTQADSTLHATLGSTSEMVEARSSSLNLESLYEFHHFTRIVSQTLPPLLDNDVRSPDSRERLIELALSRQSLMCGLLALSATHRAMTEQDSTELMSLHKRALEMSELFNCGSSEHMQLSTDNECLNTTDEACRIALVRITALLCCAHYTSTVRAVRQDNQSICEAQPSLTAFLSAIRNFLDPKQTGQEVTRQVEHGTLTASGTASIHPLDTPDVGGRVSAASPTIPHTPLTARLQSLPYNMAHVFGKPEDGRDALACLAAIQVLADLQSSERTLEETWRAMVLWLTKVPDHFNDMLARDDAAALVVLAHWACSLVNDAERSGRWWLRGMKMSLMQDIVGRLPENIRSIKSLLEGLTDL